MSCKFLISLMMVVMIMECSIVNADIPSLQYQREIIYPNYHIKTDQIYLGIRTNTCYFNGKSRVVVAGFLSSLKMPLKKHNNIMYVPSLQNVVRYNPSYQAGLRFGDEILEYNGQDVNNERHFTLLISRTLIGTSARIKVLRGGDVYEMSIFPEIRYVDGSLYNNLVVYKLSCDELYYLMK